MWLYALINEEFMKINQYIAAIGFSFFLGTAYANDVEIISNCADLQNINSNEDSLRLSYKIEADVIDCSEFADTFQPIGTYGQEFTGIFDGNNVPIINLSINRPGDSYVGLFGAMTGNSEIRNINLVDAQVVGDKYVALLLGARTETESYGKTVLSDNKISGEKNTVTANSEVGGLVGIVRTYVDSGGALLINNTIENLHLEAKNVLGSAGGLVGEAFDTDIKNNHINNISIIANASSSGGRVGGLVGAYITTVNGKYIDESSTTNMTISSTKNIIQVGGLVGLLGEALNPIDRVNILNSHTSGSIIAESSYAGGLIGQSLFFYRSAFIYNSHANTHITQNIQQASSGIGGLVGYAQGLHIENSFATGNVTSLDKTGVAGGLVGLSDGSNIYNTYAHGQVAGEKYVGGLVGYSAYTNIAYSYATGKIVAPEAAYQGGLVGTSGLTTVSDSYWDYETTGLPRSAGGIAASTAAMQQQQTYVNWNFSIIWQPMTEKQYPQLQ